MAKVVDNNVVLVEAFRDINTRLRYSYNFYIIKDGIIYGKYSDVSGMIRFGIVDNPVIYTLNNLAIPSEEMFSGLSAFRKTKSTISIEDSIIKVFNDKLECICTINEIDRDILDKYIIEFYTDRYVEIINTTIPKLESINFTKLTDADKSMLINKQLLVGDVDGLHYEFTRALCSRLSIVDDIYIARLYPDGDTIILKEDVTNKKGSGEKVARELMYSQYTIFNVLN